MDTTRALPRNAAVHEPQPSTATDARPWHASRADEALAALQATAHGLAPEEARLRLERHGPNRLREAPPPSALVRFARQFDNLLLYVLMGAALVTTLLGHVLDAAVITAVVLLNAAIGFVQEGKAERALQAIRHLLAPHAVVVRGGRQMEIDAADVVPGDIVLLASGDSLPADVRLIEAHNLRVDEAALTGESVPVDKSVEPVAAEAAIGDRTAMAYAGTLVTQGQARAVVVATGADTELGRIGRLLESVDEGSTPLLQKMARFGHGLTVVILAAAALLFVFGTWARGQAAGEMFLAAVGLAVAAIPEGLPAILTITLAIGVQRMARRQAVIRRLPAVETLGSVTVICTDKTGTLTRNEMTVQEVVVAGGVLSVQGVGYAPQGELRLDGRAVSPAQLAAQLPAAARLVEAAALCNDASLHESQGQWVLAGDPTEGALLTLAMKAGLAPGPLRQERPRLDVIPFESEHRFMATLHPRGERHVACVKGAPERVLAMCRAQLGPDGQPQPVDAQFWHEQVERQAGAGRRVLALAECECERKTQGEGTRARLDRGAVEGGLTLLGLVALIDPPREEAVAAVAQCQAAGIRVVMITGDHAVTATAIAGQLGMGQDLRALTGPQIEALDGPALQESVRSASSPAPARSTSCGWCARCRAMARSSR